MIRVGVRRLPVRQLLERMIGEAVRAVDPGRALTQHLRRTGATLFLGTKRYALPKGRRVVVVGAGKAAATMARAVEGILGPHLEGGCVVTKYHHRVPTKRIEVVEAGHPVPDEAGVAAGRRILDLVRSLKTSDLLLVLISGGASSLLPAPAPGLTLADKQRVTGLLLKSGASIQEVNTVRKHLSAIKGGQLAAATKARVLSFILSDVLGDDLASIGSGPTAPDPTTFREALSTLRRYRLITKVPPAVRAHLQAGARAARRETPKPGSTVFRRVQHHIIGNNQAAVSAVARVAWRRGIRPLVLTTTLTGEARVAAQAFGALARQVSERGRPLMRPCCILAGGELTVTVKGRGQGGRAQEFALAAAKDIAGLRNLWIVGVGTDGTDGPTDAAGAVVDGRTWQRAQAKGCRPARALAENNAYPLLKRLGQLIHTGPTGTNVNDLYLLLAL